MVSKLTTDDDGSNGGRIPKRTCNFHTVEIDTMAIKDKISAQKIVSVYVATRMLNYYCNSIIGSIDLHRVEHGAACIISNMKFHIVCARSVGLTIKV